MTTETTSSPAVSMAVATTTTTTTPALSSSSIFGKKPLDPTVTVTRMSPQAMESAHAKLAAKADPNQSGQGQTDSKGSSTKEPMDFEATHVSRHRSSSLTRTHRVRSHSSTRDIEGKGAEGKSSSAPAPLKPKEAEKKSSRSSSTTVSTMLLKAGSVKPPGKEVGPMPKYTPGKEFKVDYSKEPCPPTAFQLDQPGGSHLEGASEQPKSTWHTDPNMPQATLQGHLQALAQAGSQHALFRSQQGMLRTRTEALHVWDAFWQIAWEPVFVDEGHAGIVLASHHELQRRNITMKADLKAACKNLETARQNTQDTLKTNAIQDKRVADLIAELEEAKTAPDHAQAEVEQLKAYNKQLLSATGQEAANAGMVELQRQLDHANQQLASQGSATSTRALAERCKELEEKLDIMAGKRDTALKRAQELLAEGRTLEAKHQELKVQLATTTAEFESWLRVADVELESKQKQYEREAEFAQGQKAEVDRLKGELKEVRDEFRNQKAELDALRAQAPPAHTVAQYQTMPPGQPYRSPMQTGTMPQGHYSSTVVPYVGAANLTALPGEHYG